MLKTAYKRDSKDRIRIYRITTVDSELIKETGLLGGALKTDRKICTPKNVGRANETTGEQQAIFQMASDYKKKLDTGYFKTVDEARNEEVLLPMLAKEFGKEEHKIEWYSAKAQSKLDGMRCLMIIEPNGETKLISRTGKEITTLPHLKKDMDLLQKDSLFGRLIFDGELYVHKESFEQNMRLLKKYRPGESEKIRFNCYDMISDLPFSHRIEEAKAVIENTAGLQYTDMLATIDVNSTEEVEDYHAICIAGGYEGVMVRWGVDGYKMNGRSSNLLKFKKFDDIALRIESIVPNDANPEHGTPVFILNGKVFKAGVRMSHEERCEMITHPEKFINKFAEVRYFGVSETGVPRFPVMVGLRLDK
jgi:DNA ligase-1